MWHEVMGNDVSARDIIRMAREAGCDLERFITDQIVSLATENPQGGWPSDPEAVREIAHTLAREIEDAAEQR